MYPLTEQERTYPQADQEYIKARNRLIPRAAQFANAAVIHGKNERKDLEWSTAFLRRMDELAREKGIVGRVTAKQGR